MMMLPGIRGGRGHICGYLLGALEESSSVGADCDMGRQ